MIAPVRLRAARARRTVRAWLAAPLLALAAFAAFAGNPQPQRAPPIRDPQSAFESQSVPSTMVAGQSYAVSVTMRNTAVNSVDDWSLGFYLTAVNPINNTTWGLSNVQVGTVVPAGSSYTFNFTVVAPSTPGTYGFKWQMSFNNSPPLLFGAFTNNVNVVVTAPNAAPTVSLTTPVNGASYTIGTTVPLTATASDSDGTVSKVEFLVDGSKVGQATSSPYTYNWTGTAGDHGVVAKATDNAIGSASTATITIHGTPAVPTLTVPSTSATGSYSASWTTSSGATHYELSEQVGAGSWSVIQDTSATSKSLSGKTNGTYSYKVRACAGSGTGNCSGYSATGTMTVAIPPGVPTLTVPSTSSTGSYSASWTTSSGATHYELSEQVGAGSWSVIQDASATSKSLSGKADGSYSYKVRACTGSGTGNCSASSSTKTVTVALPPPPVTLTRTYTYDANQRLCSVSEPETGVTVMGYDAAGNLTWSATGLAPGTACSSDGNTTAINARKAVRTYDVRNRVATLAFPDANGNQNWSYTDDGLPLSVTTYNDAGASNVVNTYAYNKRRLLTGESQASGSNTWTVGYGYDGNANLSTLVYPDSLTVNYAPNALGQPTQAGTYATNVTYYPNGAIAGFTYGNGIVHTLTQNARGLPDRSKDADGSTSVHDDSYDYDTVGNVLAISDAVSGNRGNRDMVYDDLNRLVQVVSPAVTPAVFGTATYTYDVLDNLTHVHVTAGAKPRDQDYVYDEHNRLTNLMEGGASVDGLGYDVQGNLANRNGETYAFDYGNRMRSGGPETYRYDVQGRRIRSSSSAGVIYSLYAQSGQLLFQRDERSSKRRQYIYLGGSLVAESDMPLVGSTATVTYQHTDALGSPVATTDSAKAVLQRSEYEPYGYLLNRAMEDGPGYTGHVTDAATGLVYMQQRYMDPLIGQRFLSVDPVTAYSPGGAFNQYWYASANPYGMVDPDGRSPNKVYEASGGDFESWDSVSAGKPAHKSMSAQTSSSGSASESPFSIKTAQSRLIAALKALDKLKEKLEGQTFSSMDDAATAFHDAVQPISTKYGVEIESLIDDGVGVYQLSGTDVGNRFREDGIGYTVNGPSNGLPTVHSHPLVGSPDSRFFPFSGPDRDWFMSSPASVHYLSNPNGTYRFDRATQSTVPVR